MSGLGILFASGRRYLKQWKKITECCPQVGRIRGMDGETCTPVVLLPVLGCYAGK